MIASREKIEPKCMTREERPCQLQSAHSTTTTTPNQHTSPPQENSSGMNQVHDCVATSTKDGIAANIPRPNRPNDSRISDERSSSNCTDRSSQCNPPVQKRRGSPPPALRRSKSHYPGHHANPSNVSKRSIALKSTKSARILKPSSGILRRSVREQQHAGQDQRKHDRNEERDRVGLSSRAGNRTLDSKPQLLDTRTFSSSRSVRNLWTKPQHSTKRLQGGKGRPQFERSKSRRQQFVPQQSVRICRRFDEQAAHTKHKNEDDIWVERIILNGPSGRTKTCFRSLRGNVTRNEPPTGASTIIYLEDIIVDRKQAMPAPNTKALPQQSETGSKEMKKGSLASKKDGQHGKLPKQAQQKQRTGLFGFMKKKGGKNKN